jgi:hypothetical protein
VECDDDVQHTFDYFEFPDKLYQYKEYLAWGLAYYTRTRSEAFAQNPGEIRCEARQIWWKVGQWRPNPELHSLFQQIGRCKHGEALKEYWDDDEFGQELGWRGYFEHWTSDE